MPLHTWVVAVGVSRYADPGIALAYAARDAAAIDAFFASPAGGSVPSDHRVLLLDDRATRAEVLEQLTSVAQRTGRDDLLVIFLAMHGATDAHGQLYFLAHDTRPESLVGTGLRNAELESVIHSADARRVLLLADACHSGGMGLESSGTRALAATDAHRLLFALGNTRPGTAILSASRNAEYSFEDARWGGGHGVFTWFLLRGLGGEADSNRNGLVTISELNDYLYRTVPQETAGAQHPELKGDFVNEMPVSVVAVQGVAAADASGPVASSSSAAAPAATETEPSSDGADRALSAAEVHELVDALRAGLSDSSLPSRARVLMRAVIDARSRELESRIAAGKTVRVADVIGVPLGGGATRWRGDDCTADSIEPIGFPTTARQPSQDLCTLSLARDISVLPNGITSTPAATTMTWTVLEPGTVPLALLACRCTLVKRQ